MSGYSVRRASAVLMGGPCCESSIVRSVRGKSKRGRTRRLACEPFGGATESRMGRMSISQHDSPLGRWTRALYVPEGPLAKHVELFWHVAGRALFARDRRLPTGNAHVLFNLGTPAVLFGREPHKPPRTKATSRNTDQNTSFIE